MATRDQQRVILPIPDRPAPGLTTSVNTSRLVHAAPTTARTDFGRSEVEVVLRRVRQVGFALLVAAVLVDAGEARLIRLRSRLNMLSRQLADSIDRRGAGIAELGRALLDVSDGSRPTR